MSTSIYTFPELKNNSILYRGKRYRVYAIDSDHPFEGYEDMGNFIIYDGRLDAVSVVGTIKEGGVSGSLAFSHVEIMVPTNSDMKSFVQNAAKVQEQYQKDTLG